MASVKINSALVLILLSSMTAFSLWKAMPDKNHRESTTKGGKTDVADAGEGKKDVPKPTATASTRGSSTYEVFLRNRLPQEVTPMTYRLRLIPILDEKESTFTGDVTIVVRAESAAYAIIMHSDRLIISDYRVVKNDEISDINLIKTIKIDDDRDFFIMKLKERLAIGEMYTISMKFKGILTEFAWYNRHGFSKVSYKGRDGSTQWMAVSYFMPTYARRAFPCFDEPHLKANFTISIARMEDMTSLSNMELSGPPESDSNLPETYVWDHYRESPKMSTYLVAFIVSKFKSKKAEGKVITAWAREDFIDDLDRALSDGIKILDAMQTFTKTKLDLPKMDLIAVPDLSFPGIGSAGLVECREMDVLYRKGVSSARDLQEVTVYTAHDITHQWFGYLVTPEWWGYRWLNEGFAVYLSYTSTDMIEPSWRVLEQFTVVIQQPTFYIDSLDSSSAMAPPVEKNFIIQNHLHGISYNKGCSLIRMMEHFLTRNCFREALRVYLSTRRHNSSTDDEFFDIMDAQAKADGVLQENLNVRDIMESWTQMVGFPILNVERNYEDGSITLSQEKFVLNRAKYSDEGVWWIPITFTTKESPDFEKTSPSQWMGTNHTSLTQDKTIPTDTWAIFNLQQTGFYRVNYDERNWKLITEYLNSEDFYKVHPINRAQLIDDAFNLARYEYLDYRLALDLGAYLARETDYIPWYTAFEALEYLHNQLAASEEYSKFKSFVLHLINSYYEVINIEESPEDDHLKRLSRSKVTLWACRYGHNACGTTATKFFKQWMETKINTICPTGYHLNNARTRDNYTKFDWGDPSLSLLRMCHMIKSRSKIPVDSRKAVYCTAISVGGEQEWNFLWDEFLSSTIWNEQVYISEALGCSRDKATLNRYLAKSINKKVNLTNDERKIIFTAITNTPDGRDVTLDFPLSKLLLGQNEYLFEISKLAERISTKVQMEKMINEINIAYGIIPGDFKMAEVKVLEANNLWREKNVPIIEAWLKVKAKTNKS